MKIIFLTYEARRYTMYGVGTYLHQLLECFRNLENISLNIVELYSSCSEFKIIPYAYYKKYCIPKIDYITEEEEIKSYYLRSFFLLKTHIIDFANNQLFFHFNIHKPFIYESAKIIFPHAKIISTIHFHEMLVEFKGDVNSFEKNLKDNSNIRSLFLKEKQSFKNIDHFICMTQYSCNLLKKHFSIPVNKISLIYNGLKDNFTLLSKQEKNELKDKLHINHIDKIIIFVGRLDSIKGVDLLIDAFKKVIDNKPNCLLLIIGEGDFSKYIERCNSYWPKIIFTGKIDKEDLYKIYQIADLGVLPSFYEQCSYSIIEMMMYNIPIIGSNCIGIDEMIVDEKSKIKITNINNNASSLVQELSNLIIYKLFNKEICINRNIYLQRYSFDKMRIQIQELYNGNNSL